MNKLNYVRAAIVSCAILGTGVTAQAESPFNPDNLGSAQFTRVEQICETVLGLSANEPLEGGYRSGDDRLDYWTNHYRGCVTSLSDSLKSAVEERLLTPRLSATGTPTLPRAGGPFTYASAHETTHREQVACSALGAELSRNELESCVNGLSQTFYAVDHPIE
jgi:hypothetical protein